MKIVIINGQNHKGSSYHMGKILADKLTDGNSIVEFFLPRDLNHFCLGCYACILYYSLRVIRHGETLILPLIKQLIFYQETSEQTVFTNLFGVQV